MVYSFNRGQLGVAAHGATSSNAAVRFAAIREVRAYWDALRDDQDLPRREQINPRGMAGALHQVFMVERVAPGQARFRLAGMEINDLMGMEVRGMPLSAIFDPAARARLADLLEKVVTARTVVQLDLEADRGIGRPALRGRLLLLPLKGAAGEADLILGCLSCDGKIGRAPRRFVIARALEEVLDAPVAAVKAATPQGGATAFAARPAPILVTDHISPPAIATKSARPHLRLVGAEG